ncbi:MAG: hypothetical protein K6E51_11040 [Treponema sp.]|nr:hypothetical protein [Treponema sp.]
MEKQRRLLIAGICLVMFVFCVLSLFISRRPKKSSFLIDSTINNQFLPCPAQQLSTPRGNSFHDSLFFLLTDTQRKELSLEIEQKGSAALCISFLCTPLSEKKRSELSGKVMNYGFLYEDDITKNYTIHTDRISRPVVNADVLSLYQHALEKQVTISLGCKQLPVGFWLSGIDQSVIAGVHIAHASMGWDKDYQFFAFSSAGGSISFDTTSFDFSGATELFAATNTAERLMPRLTVGLVPLADGNYGTYERQLAVVVKNGGETITIRRGPKQTQVVLPVAALVEPFARFQLVAGGDSVSSVLMTANDAALLPREDGMVVAPYVCDPGLILKWKRQNWRNHDYELFAWNMFPHVLLFDTVNYSVQDDFFRRIAFFVEKQGYRGRLITDEELGNKHGYNAHDYKADDLAAFFNAASQQNFPLNAREYLLKDILIANGVLIANDGLLTAGEGAVISVSQETVLGTRQVLLTHEAYHGIYFSNEDFRNTVSAVYMLTENDAIAFLKAFWTAQLLNYDVSDEYLMQNEFMAYLMQRPLGETGPYFITASRRPHVAAVAKGLCDYIQYTNGQAYEQAAEVLNEYAFTQWGLAAGRVSLVSR